ncbi:ABC transporter ATP-binding protein/permease [Tropicimonas sp. IMCC6043]|uniref:ABCB family ABC transporter ATP-binding protein/permease n=1 Tax=Tropicimonas sp. IMCC6043 TaxID=2510645 RepID=UPI00101BC01A|nr:ABC transporter ATP-binding protein/permease [Tropicimonas sp. IMCC6043]RYH12430.1 ABC transporter ATP-binding protein/permease [Tropicimonas sp. IMCC6043]
MDDEEERRRGRRVLRDVLPYLWPADDPGVKIRVVAALSVLVLAKVVAVATPLLYKQAVDALAGDAPGQATLFALGAIGLTVAYGITRLFSVAFQQLRDVIFARVSQGALRQLALRTFRHIHSLSLSYHLSRKTGALNRVMERGVKGVAFLLRFLVFSIGPLLLELVMVCAVLAAVFDWRFLVVLVVTIAVYVWFTFAITEWRVRIRREMNTQDNEANQRAIDSLLNFETVKYFAADTREAERYDSSMEGYESAALKTAYSLALINLGQGLVINAGLVVVMAMAARGVASGEFTVGDFVMVNAYMLQIIMPLNFLGTVYREIRQSLVDMGELSDLLAVAPEVTDAPGAPPLVVRGGAVAFENVHFGYEPERPILRGVSFHVPAGGSLAIVGPTGAGKSTIGRLLFRFYDPQQGRLTIDGQDISGVTHASLQQAIGVVPQDTVLFNDTILYNIAYGRPEASRAEVEAAARAAELHDFVAALPKGYDTLVGERGLKLSGGEKQRVGIARTILKDPPILLLDEATSALDTRTERDIQSALARMGQGRTVLTIAHRLSTIMSADEIVVLEAGRVVERGSHAELIARPGRYADMWAAQRAAEDDTPTEPPRGQIRAAGE